MRFEIRGGGFFMILLGIVVLSSAVFIFGLLAGYDVGRQSTSASEQVATSYSIPSAPLTGAMPAPVASVPASAPSVVAANANPPASETDSTDTKSFKAPAASETGDGGATDDEAPPASEGTASNTGEERRRTASAEVNNPDATDDTADTSSDAEAPAPKRHAFNIQIQAAMDLGGANQMIRRLQRIGYPAHLVATPIDGQTWYKVEVGPYASQEAAASAQTAMRQRYNDAYGRAGAADGSGSPPPAAASRSSGGGTSEE